MLRQSIVRWIRIIAGRWYARARIENRAGVDAGIEFVNNDAGGDDFSALEP